MDKETTELVNFLRDRIKTYAATLENFKRRIGDESWMLSMERSHYAFEAAARHDVFDRVVDALTGEGSKATLESVRKYALDEVRRRASRPRHSSSPTSNIMNQEELAAWAEVLEMFSAER